jgi:uncharacterized protein YuzE
MKIFYDATVDAAYIQLIDEIRSGEVKKTYPCDPSEVQGQINLNFDAGGRLVEIEVLNASIRLPHPH